MCGREVLVEKGNGGWNCLCLCFESFGGVDVA